MHPNEVKEFGGIDRLRSYWFKNHTYARFLRNLPVARIIGNTLFVHAGLLPHVAMEINGDIQFLNKMTLRYFKYNEQIGHYLDIMESCYWTREFSDDSQKDDLCEYLKESLHSISNSVGFIVKHMVIGHNTKKYVTKIDCNGLELWYIDNGICHGGHGCWQQRWKGIN